MKKTLKGDSILKFFNLLYKKLVKINDTPQKVALGLGLGAFSGIIPGTGPLAALFLAFVFRVNRASALLGSLATNTWLSFVTFIFSIKIGSFVMRLNWQDVAQEWRLFLENFRWLDLYKVSVLKIIFPVIIGYFIVAFAIGFVVYLIILIVLIQLRYRLDNKKFR